MKATVPASRDDQGSDTDGLFRLVGIGFRRYARDPESREAAARLMLTSAVALYARLASVGDASVTTSEIIAELAQAERRRRG